jgi:hypothetical protein
MTSLSDHGCVPSTDEDLLNRSACRRFLSCAGSTTHVLLVDRIVPGQSQDQPPSSKLTSILNQIDLVCCSTIHEILEHAGVRNHLFSSFDKRLTVAPFAEE